MMISLAFVQLPQRLDNLRKFILAGVSPVVWLHVFIRGVILITAFSLAKLSRAFWIADSVPVISGLTLMKNLEWLKLMKIDVLGVNYV